jgi:adenylate cyclase class 2
MHEIETKILEVDPRLIAKKLGELGAQKLQETRLSVDWFRPKGLEPGSDPWYLRVRSYTDGKIEVTWKAKSEILGSSRKHREINFMVSDQKAAEDFLLELNLEKYAHQEKDRQSWQYENWRFDLDQYPDMPPYLEIEGESEGHIQEAVKFLDLAGHRASNQGEKILIEETYGLDWSKMYFK